MYKLKNWWKNIPQKIKKITYIITGVTILLVAIFLLIMWITVWSWETVSEEEQIKEYYASCDLVMVSIQGDIVGYVPESENGDIGDVAPIENIIYQLEHIEERDYPAVLLDITSWGGSFAPAKELADFIAQMKTPVIVSIREAGLSGGYYIASQADQVFASPFSDIGSIGVTMSYLDESRLNEREGYTWNSLSTGKFKDAGSTEKPLTPQERALFERDLAILHDTFVADVARGRNLPLETVRSLADGSSVLAERAVELGLIDGVKHQWDVIKDIQEKYNLGDNVCWE